MQPQIIEPTGNATPIQARTSPPSTESDYVNVSPEASAYGIRLAVLLDRRLLTDYCELDPSLGDDTTGLILSLLAYHLLTGTVGSAGRLPAYLLRRADRQLVEVDLLGTVHGRDSGQRLYLRIAGVHELDSPVLN